MAHKIKITKVNSTTIVETYDDKKPAIKDIYSYNQETDVVLNKRLNSIVIPAPKNSEGLKELHLTLENADFSNTAQTIEELLDEMNQSEFFVNSGTGGGGGSLTLLKEDFEYDTNPVFSLSQAPSSVITVTVNHTPLSEGDHYTVSGSDLDLTPFSGSLFSGDIIYVTYV